MKDKKFISIVLAIIVIAFVAILVVNKTSKNSPNKSEVSQELNLRKISKEDLVKGNPNSKIIIYEYSDLECPFCKEYHKNLNAVVKEYPETVAWVYRHLPLEQLHSKAKTEAMAVECVSKLKGPKTAFEYLNKIFEITPSNNGLDIEKLPALAKELGVDEKKFKACLDKKETLSKVEKDAKEAMALGAQGTPFTVIEFQGQKTSFSGSLSKEQLKTIIDALLKIEKNNKQDN